MIIYIDENFKCHPYQEDGLRAVDVSFFEGKCAEFISGYYHIPYGETMEYNDKILKGDLTFPFESFDKLNLAQRNYEQELAEAARILLGVQ